MNRFWFCILCFNYHSIDSNNFQIVFLSSLTVFCVGKLEPFVDKLRSHGHSEIDGEATRCFDIAMQESEVCTCAHAQVDASL